MFILDLLQYINPLSSHPLSDVTMPPSSRYKKEMNRHEKEEFLTTMLVTTASSLERHGLTLDDIGVPPLCSDPLTCSGHSIKGNCLTCRLNMCQKCGNFLCHLHITKQTPIWSGDCGSTVRHASYHVDAEDKKLYERVKKNAERKLRVKMRREETQAVRQEKKNADRRAVVKVIAKESPKPRVAKKVRRSVKPVVAAPVVAAVAADDDNVDDAPVAADDDCDLDDAPVAADDDCDLDDALAAVDNNSDVDDDAPVAADDNSNLAVLADVSSQEQEVDEQGAPPMTTSLSQYRRDKVAAAKARDVADGIESDDYEVSDSSDEEDSIAELSVNGTTNTSVQRIGSAGNACFEVTVRIVLEQVPQ